MSTNNINCRLQYATIALADGTADVESFPTTAKPKLKSARSFSGRMSSEIAHVQAGIHISNCRGDIADLMKKHVTARKQNRVDNDLPR